jgi:hypothetical protein
MTDVDDYWEPGDDRGPREPDWEAIEYAEHCEEVHGGEACDCPRPSREETDAEWEEREREHRAAFHGGSRCDCEAPF